MGTGEQPSILGNLKKEFLSFNEKKKTLKETLKNLADTSTLHGITKIASSRQLAVKLLWCILFIASFSVFTIQLIQLFKTFYSFPVQTAVSLDFHSIGFPAITICNMNPVRNSQLHKSPEINDVLNTGSEPNMLLRKRRETTRSRQATTRSDTKSSGHLSELPKPQHKSDTVVEKKKSDKVVKEPVNENDSPVPKHDNSNLQTSYELSFASHKGLRRRKRDAVTSDISGHVSTDSSQPGSSESTAYQSSAIAPTSTYASSTGTNHGASFPFYNYATSSHDASSPEYSMSWSQDTSSPSVAMSSSAYNNSDWYSEYYDAWAAWYDYYGTSYKPYWYDNDYNYDNYWYDWYNYNTWSDYSEGGSFFFDQLRSKKDEWDERVENFRTVFKNESLEQRKELGHQKEDMIVAATFAGRVQNVSHLQNFTSVDYGNCYTMASPKYVAWRSGPAHGVKLTLNLEIDEYVPNLSTGYGIRIVFHEPGTYPLPSHEGITLSPGTETNIGLRMVRITRLGEPHGKCVKGEQFSERYHKKYSTASCYEFCRIHKTIQVCNCIPTDAPEGINLNFTVLPVCNSSVKSMKACLMDVDVMFDNGEYSCDCEGPCRETVYAKTMSSTYWPTDDYLEVLISELCEKNHKSNWAELCSNFQTMTYWELDRFRYNFLRVLVYFEDLNYESITEEPMYEGVRFLSDIGGAMGLFLGASVLSFVEVMQLLLELILFVKHKWLVNNKTRVTDFSSK